MNESQSLEFHDATSLKGYVLSEVVVLSRCTSTTRPLVCAMLRRELTLFVREQFQSNVLQSREPDEPNGNKSARTESSAIQRARASGKGTPNA